MHAFIHSFCPQRPYCGALQLLPIVSSILPVHGEVVPEPHLVLLVVRFGAQVEGGTLQGLDPIEEVLGGTRGVRTRRQHELTVNDTTLAL